MLIAAEYHKDFWITIAGVAAALLVAMVVVVSLASNLAFQYATDTGEPKPSEETARQSASTQVADGVAAEADESARGANETPAGDEVEGELKVLVTMWLTSLIGFVTQAGILVLSLWAIAVGHDILPTGAAIAFQVSAIATLAFVTLMGEIIKALQRKGPSA